MKKRMLALALCAALLCIIIVQVIQEVGMYIVRKTDKRTSA